MPWENAASPWEPKRGYYLHLDGTWKRVPAGGLTACASCGMVGPPGEYHPFAACELFKVHRDSRTVRANIYAVVAFGRKSEAP
jgi:hypothetical protein